MISAIVLAAGSSRRMGNINKLLLTYKNKAVVTHVVENILASGVEDLIVVTGFEAENIRNVLSGLPVHFVMNEYHAVGLTTSIQQGVLHARGDAYMICLADMLLIEPGEYALVAKNFEEQVTIDQKCICLPAFNNQKGNPVIFSSFYRQAILNHEDTEGCKAIVQSNRKHVGMISMNTDHILQDMDYPEDVRRILG